MKKDEYNTSLPEILRGIGCMNEAQLQQAVFSVMERYQALFPGEEIVFLSLPRDDPAERRRIIEGACRFAEVECMG